MSTSQAPALVELAAKELQGPGVIACPHPAVAAWSHHPRVYIDVASHGEGTCPYCGTVFKLKAGEKVHGGH